MLVEFEALELIFLSALVILTDTHCSSLRAFSTSKLNGKQRKDIPVVSSDPDCREATVAQFVVYFVPAIFQNISQSNRMKAARSVVKEVLLFEQYIRRIFVQSIHDRQSPVQRLASIQHQ